MANLINIHRGNYTNVNAVENVIRYVTRTRINEDRAHELFSFGGAGVSLHLGVEVIISQFLYAQNIYQKGGRQLLHESFGLKDDDFAEINYDLRILDQIAKECCQIYFSKGFQVIYAVHDPDDDEKHIHFVVNGVSYRNGKKWHSSISEDNARECMFNEFLNKYKCQLHPLSIEELYN